jgi:hypothetical protein
MDEQAWNAELNALEEKLMKAIEQRVKPCSSAMHTLKLAFKAVDFDELGHPADSGSVSYPEFCAALERFGLYASQGVRGLYDRYKPGGGADDDMEPLNYLEFAQGLYGSHKPWPPPPKREATMFKSSSAEQVREAPPNRWGNSTAEGSPDRRPVRAVSLANPKWREQAPKKWKQDEKGAWQEVFE